MNPDKNIWKNKSFVKYFKNTSWLAAERILRIFVQFAVIMLVARYLGPRDFGILSYAISVVGLVSIIAPLGVSGVIVRELVKSPGQRDVLIGTYSRIYIFGTMLVYILIGLFVLFTKNEESLNVIIFVIALGVLFQSTNIIDYYFQANVQSKYVVIAQIIQLVISSIFKILLIFLNVDLIWFALAFLLDSLVLAFLLISIYAIKIGIRKYHLSFDRNLAITLIRKSWPLLLSGIFVSIYMKIDQIMIKEMLGEIEVGYYAAAVRISEAWYFIPMIISSSIFPGIVRARQKNIELYYSSLQMLYRILVWIGIAIALLVTFSADVLINIFLGAEYSTSKLVLVIHVWAGIFVALGVGSSNYLLAEEMQNISFYRTLVGAVINIILNFLLIPHYGIVGAAIATLVSYMFATFGVILAIRNEKLRIMIPMMFKAFIPWRGV